MGSESNNPVNLLTYVWPAITALAGAWVLYKWPMVRRLGWPAYLVVAAWCYRLLMAGAYTAVHNAMYQGGDAWEYWKVAQPIVDLFRSGKWTLYAAMVFGPNTQPPPELLKPYAFDVGYWNDDGAYLLVRFHALLGLLSGGSLAVHVVVYNFLCMVGCLYLYRFLSLQFPQAHTAFHLLLFWFPSVVFWTSGMHKEGLALAALGGTLFAADSIFARGTYKNLFILCFCLLPLWLLRNFWVVLIFPFFAAYLLVKIKHTVVARTFAWVLLAYFGALWAVVALRDAEAPLAILKDKQQEFVQLPAQTKAPHIVPLNGKVGETLAGVAKAFMNLFIQPVPTPQSSWVHYVAFGENVLVLLTIIFVLFMRNKTPKPALHLVYFSVGFALTLYLLVAIAVPVTGAMFRYKMVGTLFLLAGFAVLLNRNLSWANLNKRK